MDYPTWDPASKNTPLTDDELAALDDALQSLPADGAMTLDGMDGYLTALLVGPPFLRAAKTADWLPAIWGGDPEPGSPAPFASNQKKKRTTVLVLRHLQAIYAQLRDDPEHWEPVFSVAEAPGADGDELADATEWCLGFLQATDLAPQDWGPLFDDADFGPLLAPIRLLGEGEESGPGGESDDGEPLDLDDPAVRDQLSREAAEAVLALWSRPGAPGAAAAANE
jgi:uncharacterized protein